MKLSWRCLKRLYPALKEMIHFNFKNHVWNESHHMCCVKIGRELRYEKIRGGLGHRYNYHTVHYDVVQYFLPHRTDILFYSSNIIRIFLRQISRVLIEFINEIKKRLKKPIKTLRNEEIPFIQRDSLTRNKLTGTFSHLHLCHLHFNKGNTIFNLLCNYLYLASFSVVKRGSSSRGRKSEPKYQGP